MGRGSHYWGKFLKQFFFTPTQSRPCFHARNALLCLYQHFDSRHSPQWASPVKMRSINVRVMNSGDSTWSKYNSKIIPFTKGFLSLYQLLYIYINHISINNDFTMSGLATTINYHLDEESAFETTIGDSSLSKLFRGGNSAIWPVQQPQPIAHLLVM